MTQVQVRMPEHEVKAIDNWVKDGRFMSRSDAIKTIVALYEEHDKTKAFLKMLESRSEWADKHPEQLVELK